MNHSRPNPQVMTRDGAALDRAIVAARKHVIRRHRQLGIPLVIWRDGKVVEVDPASLDDGADADAVDAARSVAAGAKSG